MAEIKEILARAETSFKFSRYAFEEGNLYRMPEPAFDYCAGNNWMSQASPAADEKPIDMASQQHLKDFLGVMSNAHLGRTKHLRAPLRATPPKTIN